MTPDEIRDLLARCFVAVAEVDYDLRAWEIDLAVWDVPS